MKSTNKQSKMKWLNYFIILTLSFLIYNCGSTDPKPPDTKPPGYQEDIPWPSLADSPWPVAGKSAQGNARFNNSIFIGTSYIKEIEAPQLYGAGITVESDSVIYYCSVADIAYLIKANINSDIIWKKNLGTPFKLITNPLLVKESKIIAVGGDGYRNTIFCYDTDGKLNWNTNLESNGSMHQTSVCVDKDSNYYILMDSGTLYCLSPDGDILYSVNDPRFNVNSNTQMTFSVDGETLYIPGYNGISLIAFSLSEKGIKWTFGNNPLEHTPVVDAEDNIYIIPFISYPNSTAYLYKLNKDGEELFNFSFTNKYNTGYTAPTVDYLSNVLFISDSIYSVNMAGKINWKKDISGVPSNIIADKNNNIYFINYDDTSVNLNGYDIDGNIIIQKTHSVSGQFYFNGSISTNGNNIFVALNTLNKIIVF